MAAGEWFYAVNNEEKGPVAEGELKSLVAKGVVRADTLVWREGLANWTPARQVTGLFAAAPATSPASQPTAAATAPPAAAPAAPPPIVAAPPVAAPVIQAEEGVLPQTYRRAARVDPRYLVQSAGWPLLAGGLMLVLLAKGCDSLGSRQVTRLQGKAKIVENRFQDKYDRERLDLEQRRDDFRKRNDDKGVAETNEKLAKLTEEHTSEQDRLRRTDWRDLAIASRDAEAENRQNGYWRECLFVFGSMVLSLGLLAVSYSGQGAERWVCLVMLAIITFSIYVGGTAWIAALRGG